MAEAKYMIEFSAETEEAGKNMDDLAKKQKGVGAAVDETEKKTGKLNAKMIAFGATMVATAGSVIFMGASLETAMFKSRVALEQAGASAEELAASLNAAGRAASELLPVAAQFASIGVAGEELEGVTVVAQNMGDVLGKSAKEVTASLTRIGAAAQLKTKPQFEALASGLIALERAYPGVYDANARLLESLGAVGAEYGVNAAALTGLNTAMIKGGAPAGEAATAFSKIMESVQEGEVSFRGLAESMRAPGASLAAFDAAAGDTSKQILLMFEAMRGQDPLLFKHKMAEILKVGPAAAQSILNMANNTERLNGIMGVAGAGFKDNTALVKAQKEWSETLNGALSELWRSLRAIGQETGAYLVPFMLAGVKALQGLAWLVSKTPKPIRALVVALMAWVGVSFMLKKLLQNDLVVGLAKTTKETFAFAKAVIVGTAKTLGFVGALILEKAELAFVRAEALFHTAVMKAQNAVYAIGRGIKMAFVAVMQSEILATVLATAKKWLLVAAQGALNAVMLIGKGIFLGVGIVMGTMTTLAIGAATALWGMAVAAWAAIAPLLPFIVIGALIVAAVVAIGAAIYYLVRLIADNWTAIWTTARNVVMAAWDGLVALWGIAVQVGSAVVSALVYPFKLWWQMIQAVWGAIYDIGAAVANFLLAPIRAFWSLVVTAFDAIMAPFRALWDVLQGIGGVISSVVGLIFGSSMFHLKEGVAEVMPSLRQMEGAFNAVGQAAGKVGLESHIPDDIRVRVGEPLGRMGTGRETGLSEAMSGKQAFGGPTGSGSGAADTAEVRATAGTGGGSDVGGPQRVVIPITLKVDGERLARIVHEHEIDVGRDRYMNAPSGALRGTGG